MRKKQGAPFLKTSIAHPGKEKFSDSVKMLVLCIPLEVIRHQLFKRQDYVSEKRVRQAPGERLLRAVHHDNKIRKPRERGIGASGEGHDPVAILPGMAHVVEHRLRLPALAHGEHDARSGLLVGEIVRRAEEHVVVKCTLL